MLKRGTASSRIICAQDGKKAAFFLFIVIKSYITYSARPQIIMMQRKLLPDIYHQQQHTNRFNCFRFSFLGERRWIGSRVCALLRKATSTNANTIKKNTNNNITFVWGKLVRCRHKSINKQFNMMSSRDGISEYTHI